MAGVNGKWKVVSAEGDAEAVVKATGVSAEGVATAVSFITAPGIIEELQFSSTTGKHSVEVEGNTSACDEFPLNQQIDSQTGDGRKQKLKFVLESPNKMVRYEDYEGNAVVTVTYERVGDNLIATHATGGKQVVRKMAKV